MRIKYNLQSLLLMPVSQDYPPVDYRVDGFIHCMMSLYVGEWQESTLYPTPHAC